MLGNKCECVSSYDLNSISTIYYSKVHSYNQGMFIVDVSQHGHAWKNYPTQ